MNGEQDSKSGTLIGDLTGVGKIIDSKIARRTYDEGLSPAMRKVGYLSEDFLKTFRLFTAPLQLAAAYQDRFRAFCDRVREKVPPERQREAPAEIAAPVMLALASTSDDSPLLSMFEELMARAIDVDEADKLSPDFAPIIQSLSPLQAKLIDSLSRRDQVCDVVMQSDQHLIVRRLNSDFSFADFGGDNHHLTMVQNLEKKNLATTFYTSLDGKGEYNNLKIDNGMKIKRMTTRLTMFGQWFAASCTSSGRPAQTADGRDKS